MSTAATMEARVAAGAGLLDRVSPGWEAKVSPDRLDLGDCLNCVLGELFGAYSTGLRVLSARSGGGFPWGAPETVTHGFSAGNGSNEAYEAESAALTREWRRVIAARQTAKGEAK